MFFISINVIVGHSQIPFSDQLNRKKESIEYFYCNYESSTGVFAVPPAGDGLYYYSTYLLIGGGEYAYFNIQGGHTKLNAGSCKLAEVVCMHA